MTSYETRSRCVAEFLSIRPAGGRDLNEFLAALTAHEQAITADLLAELRNIANARPETWDEDTRDQFQAWAQNRARHAIAKAESALPAPPKVTP